MREYRLSLTHIFPYYTKNNGQEKSVFSHILCSVNYLPGSKLIKLLNFYFKLKPKLATVVCNFKRNFFFFCDCSLRTHDKSRVWTDRSKCIKVITTADIGALWWPGFTHGWENTGKWKLICSYIFRSGEV